MTSLLYTALRAMAAGRAQMSSSRTVPAPRGDSVDPSMLKGDSPGRPDDEAIESAFCALQGRYPTGPILAMDANGLIGEMPASVPRLENVVLSGGSGLDSVPPEDHQQLIEAFARMLEEGTAQCVLHPPTYGAVTWYGFDLRARHGVLVALLGVDPGESSIAGESARSLARVGPPRFATTRKDGTAFFTGVDTAITEILGWTPEEMVGKRSLEFTHVDDHPLAVTNWMEMLADPTLARRFRQRLRSKDGSWVWFEVINHNYLDDPEHPCVVCEMLDISDEMAAQEALRAREELLNRLAEAVPVGLFQIDTARRIVYTNDRLHEIIGLERASTAEAQLATIVPTDRPALEQALESVLKLGSHVDIEVACARSENERVRYCTISCRSLHGDDGNISGAIACVADVTEATRTREELRLRATLDQLTGCHNRTSVMDALQADIASDRQGAERAVMFVDLDGFKVVNDRLGHSAGDRILRLVAQVLQESVRHGDLVGRAGGDEFLVICPDVGGAEPAMALAARVSRALRDVLSRNATMPSCTASIGVAWSTGDTISADALVDAADEAMYESKREREGEPKLAAHEQSNVRSS